MSDDKSKIVEVMPPDAEAIRIIVNELIYKSTLKTFENHIFTSFQTKLLNKLFY